MLCLPECCVFKCVCFVKCVFKCCVEQNVVFLNVFVLTKMLLCFVKRFCVLLNVVLTKISLWLLKCLCLCIFWNVEEEFKSVNIKKIQLDQIKKQ